MRPGDPSTVFTVSELNNAARDLLEHSFGLLWVEGEISNLARPRSGHVYFSLKDGTAQIRCALFKSKARLLRVALENGVQVRLRARVSLYPARGDFQLIVEHAEDAGAGALQRAFEELRDRLDAEGLFAAARKRALPVSPKRIGVITSATGAAIRDVLSVAARRYPLGAIRIYPVPVQGQAAPAAIVKALALANKRADCDVLLVVRGGGALEDLMGFNDEAVARAIVASALPVVSGVGHEVDVTIADLAADVRAATPSAAAELVCPDLSAATERLPALEARLRQRLIGQLVAEQRSLVRLNARLERQAPRRRVQIAAQRLDEAEQRLARVVTSRLRMHRQTLQLVEDRLARTRPEQRIVAARQRVAGLRQRLDRVGVSRLDNAQRRLAVAMRTLHGVSPLQTLARGYAIARDANDQVIRDAHSASPGDRIAIDLARGRLDCTVEASRSDRTTPQQTEYQ
ncbi:exodeoxyribonuclease VII large subunit [Salinisphaera japonica]|uniref:Exodeoxyribonuclease 7 large subunit n=1 Tax=Salinisphaera japonica YTM-1 TaxID=1209778 RepID=A0A423PEK9_9GAMM|nr:exodeoxyribonuclease VII large subunit [Salinisphaera japonica]ROO24079.1 exodeoxyribonuclease VII large subunit [Salinisphaera japonica YTM-1]